MISLAPAPAAAAADRGVAATSASTPAPAPQDPGSASSDPGLLPFLLAECDQHGCRPEDVLMEFKIGREFDKVEARARQAKLAHSVERLEKARIAGLGRFRMRIDAQAFHYWGQRDNNNYDNWRDQGFLREFERDNPAVKVPQNGSLPIVTVSRKLKSNPVPNGALR